MKDRKENFTKFMVLLFISEDGKSHYVYINDFIFSLISSLNKEINLTNEETEQFKNAIHLQ